MASLAIAQPRPAWAQLPLSPSEIAANQLHARCEALALLAGVVFEERCAEALFSIRDRLESRIFEMPCDSLSAALIKCRMVAASFRAGLRADERDQAALQSVIRWMEGLR